MFENIRAYILFERARTAQRKNEQEVSISNIKKLIELNPVKFLTANAESLWGEIEFDRSNFHESTIHFQAALKIAKENSNLWSKKKYEEFVSEVKNALQLSKKRNITSGSR